MQKAAADCPGKYGTGKSSTRKKRYRNALTSARGGWLGVWLRGLVRWRLHSSSRDERVATTAAQPCAVFFARTCWDPRPRGLTARCSRFHCSCRAAEQQVRGAPNRSRRTSSRLLMCPCLRNACSACQPSWGSWRSCDTAAEQVVCLPASAGRSRRAPPDALWMKPGQRPQELARGPVSLSRTATGGIERQQQQNLAERGGQEGVVAA